MFVSLFRAIVCWLLDAAVVFLAVFGGTVGGFCLGMLGAILIVRLDLGPPSGACGLAWLLLMPAPLSGALAGALGAAVGRVTKGVLVGGGSIAVAAILLVLYAAVFGSGDAVTRSSTVAVAGTLIGLGGGLIGGTIASLLSFARQRLPGLRRWPAVVR